MITNSHPQYTRKTLANTLLKPKSLLDVTWEKVLEAGGTVPQIVMHRLSMYKRTQSLESKPTQVIERKKLTRENVTIVPRSFVFKTEKMKHVYFQTPSRIFQRSCIKNASDIGDQIEDELESMEQFNENQDDDIVVVKENQQSIVEEDITNDVFKTQEFNEKKKHQQGIILKQHNEKQNENKEQDCNKQQQQTTKLKVFPQCFDISQYNAFEQLIISKRINASKQQKNKQRQITNIETIIQLQNHCDQISIKQTFQNSLNHSRSMYYDFKVCQCDKKHTILYYQNYKVPSLELKKYLVFDHFKANQFISVQDLVLKIQKIGFKWHKMQKQINNIINLERSLINQNQKKYFKSYIFKKGNYKKQNNYSKVFNFSKCIKVSDYSSERQRCAFLYLISKQKIQKDKILKNPQIKKYFLKYQLKYQQSNKVKKQIIHYIVQLFNNFTISKCLDCEDDHFILKFMNKIVPNSDQKVQLLTYYKKLHNKRITYFNKLKLRIKKSILLQGYDWKFIGKNIQQFIKTDKIQSLKQEFVQNLSSLSQCESNISKSSTSQQSQTYSNVTQQNIISPLKPVEQEIAEYRENILKNTRNSKRNKQEIEKKTKRQKFIKTFTPKQ